MSHKPSAALEGVRYPMRAMQLLIPDATCGCACSATPSTHTRRPHHMVAEDQQICTHCRLLVCGIHAPIPAAPAAVHALAIHVRGPLCRRALQILATRGETKLHTQCLLCGWDGQCAPRLTHATLNAKRHPAERCHLVCRRPLVILPHDAKRLAPWPACDGNPELACRTCGLRSE